jgi:hypothetical protein
VHESDYDAVDGSSTGTCGLHPVSRTPRLGVMMELEVCHGSQATYA